MRLFCFPYAGGGASVYRGWAEELPPTVEVCPIQLPGREERWGETPFTSLSALVEILANVLHPMLNLPFAFFGHSMGALIAFELTRQLRRETGETPLHLFISGSRAPQIPDPDPPLHQLPDSEFIEELTRLNGIPEEIRRNTEFMEMVLPTIRADMTLCETYAYVPEAPLPCPITAFGGNEDKKTTGEQVAGWNIHTQGEFILRMYPGDHFFLLSSRKLLLEALSSRLSQSLTRMGG